MNTNNQIKTGAILTYISIGINILAGFIYTPWIINQIGSSDYGLYTLANSLISLFLLDFGLSSATSRYLSKYVAEGNQEKADRFLGTIYKLYLIIDAVIFIALIVIFLFIDIIYANLTPQEITKFKVVYSIAALYAVINFPFVTLNGVLTAYEKFFQLKLADIISRVLIVLLTVGALALGLGLYSLVLVNAVAGILIIVYKLIVINKVTPIKVSFEKSEKGLYKSIFKFSLWTTVIILAERMVFNFTPTILGIVSNSTAIAIFGVITTIEHYSYLLTSAINGLFLPKLSKIYMSKEGDADIMPLMIKVGRFQFAINSLIVVGFAVVGKSFITLWMGNDFRLAYMGILFVIIPGMFYNPLQIANTAMVVKNKLKEQAIVILITGLFYVTCSFVLSYKFGVLGACFSIFLAYLIRAVLFHILYNKCLKINILYFMKKCYLRMLPSVIITLITGILLNCVFASDGWIMLAFKAILLLFAFIISILMFCLTKQERNGIVKSVLSLFKR